MKEEHAILPILIGIALAMIATHVMTLNGPAAQAAEFVLLFGSVASILGGIFSYCSMTATSSKSIARQMLELEEVSD